MKLTPPGLLLAVLVAAGAAVAPAQAADYVIDTAKSHASINFRIKHLGYSWLTGRFNDFAGTFAYDEAHPEASKIKVEVKTDSIDSNHAERDKHLRSKEFLDTAAYPTATFESTGVKVNDGKATITGNFTLHVVTNPIEIASDRVGVGDDPWGGFRQGFSGTTRIPLKDFGINFDLGPASQEVELTLNIEGVRQ